MHIWKLAQCKDASLVCYSAFSRCLLVWWFSFCLLFYRPGSSLARLHSSALRLLAQSGNCNTYFPRGQERNELNIICRSAKVQAPAISPTPFFRIKGVATSESIAHPSTRESDRQVSFFSADSIWSGSHYRSALQLWLLLDYIIR
ncbi:hypothetical protein B0H63DRAFT_161733 [Podospora didyma]|uniref:Uncharacterized protein n=1 Tax=Podospora didyma TaxID=330526 RepID=A0AAE0NTV1_9PEZI|nr:hypothetical protein B0H63DRAFT_161733 [Podospora didyma]